MKFKYFIWDIGGTLFDTTATSVKAFAQTLSEFGQTPDEQKIFELLKEKSTPVAARYFMGDKQDEFLKRYHEIETPMQENPVMFSDTKETLKQVVASGGKNYIISHRDLQVVDFLESCDLIGYF
ncbi:MAG: HAD hydrolase-like protein, partial [Streptococcaceae bacterium]|nr:HAD hydrolase-like protein [Streptococcaceae bacterium]